MVSSGIIHLTFVVFAVSGAPELYAWIEKLRHRDTDLDHARCYAYFLWYVCLLAQIVAQCFADPRVESKIEDKSGRRSKELDGSFVNRLTLWWYTPIPLLGAKKDLEVKDLFDLNEGNSSGYLVPLWEKFWLPTVKRNNSQLNL